MRFWSQTFEVDLSLVKGKNIADETQQIRQLLDADICQASLPQREATSSTSVTCIGLTFTSEQNNTGRKPGYCSDPHSLSQAVKVQTSVSW